MCQCFTPLNIVSTVELTVYYLQDKFRRLTVLYEMRNTWTYCWGTFPNTSHKATSPKNKEIRKKLRGRKTPSNSLCAKKEEKKSLVKLKSNWLNFADKPTHFTRAGVLRVLKLSTKFPQGTLSARQSTEVSYFAYIIQVPLFNALRKRIKITSSYFTWRTWRVCMIKWRSWESRD